MASRDRIGRCKLTGFEGRLAKSHVIPDAFMRRLTEAPFKEWAVDQPRPRTRFTGWYDTNLLSPAAEKLIAEYDNEAAKVLLGAGLTYRRRRAAHDPTSLLDNFASGQLVTIDNVDTDKMKLFGLSLLWRAAASDLEAFNTVQLRTDRLDALGRRLLDRDPGLPNDFPVYFSFFDSGVDLPKMAPSRMKNHPFFRFFLDGVVCYVSMRKHNFWAEKNAAPFLVGQSPGQLLLLCVSSIGSPQHTYGIRTAERLADIHGDVFQGDHTRPYIKR